MHYFMHISDAYSKLFCNFLKSLFLRMNKMANLLDLFFCKFRIRVRFPSNIPCTTLSHTIMNVIPLSTEKQVRWLNTKHHVAFVQYIEAMRDLSNKHFITKPMCRERSHSPYTKSAISLCLATSPQPTTVSYLYLLDKILFGILTIIYPRHELSLHKYALKSSKKFYMNRGDAI